MTDHAKALAPCPFCGSAPIPTGHPALDGGHTGMIYCANCGACGPEPMPRSTPELAEADASEAWNRRAAPSLTVGDEPASPAGWKLVPEKLTSDMAGAFRVNLNYPTFTPAQVWAAMLAASPAAPSQPAAQAEPVAVLREMVEMMNCGDEPGAGSDWHKRAVAALASNPPAQGKSLTEEQIVNDGLMMCPASKLDNCADAFEAGVKFAERAHGIGQAGKGSEG